VRQQAIATKKKPQQTAAKADAECSGAERNKRPLPLADGASSSLISKKWKDEQ